MLQKFDLKLLGTTDDYQHYKIPVLRLGIIRLIETQPELFERHSTGTLISKPYTEYGRWYVNVPVKEAIIALEVLQYCGDPQRIPMTFI